MCDATVLFDQYLRNTTRSFLNVARANQEDFNETFNVLAIVRIAIQHSLVSLTVEEKFEATPTSPATLTYHTCCLALLGYSDMILFATSVQSGIRARLAAELLHSLTLATEKCLGLYGRGYFAWAAVLGGIATHNSGPLREEKVYTRIILERCGPSLRYGVDEVLGRMTQFM